MIKILYIIGGIAYFLFTIYKKNKQRQEEQIAEKTDSGDSESWGMEDLISKFENKYGVETETEYSAASEEYNYVDELVEEPIVTQTQPEIINTNFTSGHNPEENSNYSEVTANHQAFQEEAPKRKSANDYYNVEIEEVQQEFDLRNMVVSSVILNRPEY